MIETSKSDLEGYFDNMVLDHSVKDIISYQTFVDYAKSHGYDWHEDDKGAATAIIRNNAIKCHGGKKVNVGGHTIILYAIRNPGKWARAKPTDLKQEHGNQW
jgi:hypothetical protein